MEVFWKTIAQYNEATWIFQVIITIAGILLTVSKTDTADKAVDEGIYGIFK